ncbi:type VI secretion system protein TssA [Massilia sp. TSP1-1-2]|uniref:type VI secretion system protein TssA n=1 Tax=unclassified Massilia TaxID=2609279 RepID=UPI003CF5785B
MFLADQLLNPIRDDKPAGDDLSFSPELDAITQARKFDDASLDQGEWVTEIKEADWDFVVKKCSMLLQQKSKDLRLAVWLAEAGAKKYRMRGLAEGLLVIAGLLDKFWDLGLYPESDGDDHDQRIGNLAWILARVPAMLREMPVTDGNSSKYTSIDFETARKNPNGDMKLTDLENAKRANSTPFRTAFAADAQYCMEALQKLEKAADERLGQDSPGFASARDALDSMARLMPATGPVSPVTEGPVTQNPGSPENGDGSAHVSQSVHMGPPGAIHTRFQALSQLRAVADFFRRTEPHSPVSYFADKAADAGDQDLAAFLRSVVKDPASMAHIEELLGIKPQE